MEESLWDIENSDNYKKYVDINSFAKYYVVAESSGNLNPNRFYVLKNKESKLEIYPFWDAEWSFGLARLSAPEGPTSKWLRYPYEPMPANEPFFEGLRYYQYLKRSTEFRRAVREEWQKYKPKIPEAEMQIKNIALSLADAQVDNFKKWDILNEYVGCCLVAFGNWQDEVDYTFGWFNERIKWFDSYINDWDK